jgi:hypothetical protein
MLVRREQSDERVQINTGPQIAVLCTRLKSGDRAVVGELERGARWHQVRGAGRERRLAWPEVVDVPAAPVVGMYGECTTSSV